MAKEKISVVVPCYNEEESLPLFYEEVCRVAKEMKYVEFEFLFINDGSKDSTLSILRDFAKKDKRVRYISYSLLRKFFTSCWYKLIGAISSVPQQPGARDYRLMKRRMVDAIVDMGEYNRYTKGIFGFVGFNTKWIDYIPPQRVAGKSKFNFFKLFKYALEGILAFSTTPLVISAIIGLVFCLISFIVIIFIIWKTLAYGDPVSGWPSLACMIMFMGGLQLFFFGIMGMYLAKVYLEVKKRPIYISKETEKDL